jgi:hypothetical protein
MTDSRVTAVSVEVATVTASSARLSSVLLEVATVPATTQTRGWGIVR